MHCPRCGEQQISSEAKFCKRCGFQLALVAELIENDGILPQLANISNKTPFFNKKNGVIFGVFWFIFFTMFLTAAFGILGVEELAGLAAITGVFGTMFIIIASLVLLPSSKINRFFMPHFPTHAPASLHSSPAHSALPPQQSQPAQVYAPPAAGGWRAPDTGEFARPSSVTENTTKLLQKDKDE
ncbi:MAG: hypothetical protein ACRD6X_03175 [Pyrinomonadaceae bacterium]